MISDPPESTPPPRRMRLTGLHHVTLLCADLARTTAFYRDTLGLALVREEANADDPDARHFWFGDAEGRPGTLVTFLEYPDLPAGAVGPGSTHHVAFGVGSREELAAWRDWLASKGVSSTEILDRGGVSSIYLRDPDGHILELAA